MKPPKQPYPLNRLISAVVLLSLPLVTPVYGGDWPQIHGPHRNGKADGESLASEWATPPKLRWSVQVGEGYAGPAVVGGRVFVFHRERDQDVLDSRSSRDGSVAWSVRWPAKYRGGIDADRGPRCVPVVRDNRVFVVSAAGDLHCVDTAGKQLWSRNLARDFQARDGYGGFGSTPLVMGDLVLVNIGGRKGAAIVALDASTGADRWKQFDDDASYAAPIPWTYAQQPCAVFITRLNLVVLRPSTGEVLFQTPFGARGPTVNAAAPLAVDGQRLFLTASYRIGAQLLQIDAKIGSSSPVRVMWENDHSLSSQYPTPVYTDGCLYGVHGREDGPLAALRCVDLATGKVNWSEPNVGMAHLILADAKLLMLTIQGELVLVKTSSKSYQELGRQRVSSSTTRAMPALSNAQIYVRDVDGQLTAWQLPISNAATKN